MTLSRRQFLTVLAGGMAASAYPGLPAPRSWAESANVPSILKQKSHPLHHAFAPFPDYGKHRIAGIGTYQVESAGLPAEALRRGARLAATSPDYLAGRGERLLAAALADAAFPVFVMTQIPVAAWSAGNRKAAFHRALRQSLGRLKRPQVEALLIRNAEPQQLADPEFRAFAAEAKRRRLVGAVGASGHGPDTEAVLTAALGDPLIEVILFGAQLHDYGEMTPLLREARNAGKTLVAMKSREAALVARVPGWEKERERRRHTPWNGRWDEGFNRRALHWVMETTGANNAVLSARHPEDVNALLGNG